MPKVILYIASSLDGFIAQKDGSVAWLDKYNGAGEDYGYGDFYKGIGSSIMGATTYEQALGFKGGIDKKKPTYVITHRKLEAPVGYKVFFYSGDLSALVEKLKKEHEGIWLVGGGKLAQAFLKEKLVDEIIISIMPDMLGEGVPLFGPGPKVPLRLRNTKTYKDGVVQLTYELQPS